MTIKWRQAARALTLTGLSCVVLAAGACSSSSGNKNSSGRDTTGSGAIGGAQEQPLPSAAPPLGSSDADRQKNGVGTVVLRSIIFTGSITVQVDDVTKAADQVKQRAEVAGGYIGSDRRSSATETTASATIVIRVPSAEFGDTVTAVSGLGKEISREFSQDDVTAQVVDLDARIATQQAGIDRIRALIKSAASTAELLSIDQELTRREADLASLQAQRDKLNDLASLSTLTVYLYGPDAAPAPKKSEKGFVAGLKNGWEAFVDSIVVLITVIGAVLPFAVAIGVPVWLIVWLARRRRAGRPVPALATPVHPAYGSMTPRPAPPAAPPPPPPSGTPPQE